MNPDPGINTASSPLEAAKTACKDTVAKVEEAKIAVMAAEVKPFKLYGKLLSNEARQPWEKVINAQVTKAPWEDDFGISHNKTPTKTCHSVNDCIMFHLVLI